MRTEAHLIICGYGRSGQNLARLLDKERIPYMALDLDPDRVRQAAAAGQSVVFGDAAKLPSLIAAGLSRATAVVITYHDTPSALKVLQHVREHAAHVPVIVRTIDDAELERLRAAGATEVVPEALEGSLMLASHALALVGVPMRRVIRITQDMRDARYGLLRGYFHGADDDTASELQQARLQSVILPPGRAEHRPAPGRPDAAGDGRVGRLGAAHQRPGRARRRRLRARRRRRAGAQRPAGDARAGREPAAEGLKRTALAPIRPPRRAAPDWPAAAPP